MNVIRTHEWRVDTPGLAEGWLQSLQESDRLFVRSVVEALIALSRTEYAPFLENCGLYAVGSSLCHRKYDDIDLVVAGLDFRAVMEYDKIFLQDPQTLIDERIVVEPQLFTVIDGCSAEDARLLKPASQTNSLETYTHYGIEHEGRYYDYNFEGLCDEALTLHHYCGYHGKPSTLVHAIRKAVAQHAHAEVGEISGLFDPYCHMMGYFFATRISAQWPGTSVIDISIHSENLKCPAWERFQNQYKLPYVALHQWPGNPDTPRSVITPLAYPPYIDPTGEQRMGPSPYFILEDVPLRSDAIYEKDEYKN